MLTGSSMKFACLHPVASQQAGEVLDKKLISEVH